MIIKQEVLKTMQLHRDIVIFTKCVVLCYTHRDCLPTFVIINCFSIAIKFNFNFQKSLVHHGILYLTM